MDTKLKNGDLCMDAYGRIDTVSGADELAQRAMIRLSVKKGAGFLSPDLGTDWSPLLRAAKDRRNSEALRIAAAALDDLPLRVNSAECASAGGRLTVNLHLEIQDAVRTVGINI